MTWTRSTGEELMLSSARRAEQTTTSNGYIERPSYRIHTQYSADRWKLEMATGLTARYDVKDFDSHTHAVVKNQHSSQLAVSADLLTVDYR